MKDDIPKEIGVWLVYKPQKNLREYMECVKKPKKQERKFTHEQLLFALMQALSREYKKYRKLLEKKE